MLVPNNRPYTRVPRPSDDSSCNLTDLTYYEAEHIPVKVIMKPLSTDPGIRLDLHRISLKRTSKPPKPLPRPSVLINPPKAIRLHSRTSSETYLSPNHLSKSSQISIPKVDFFSSKSLLTRVKTPGGGRLTVSKSPSHLVFKAMGRLR